MGWVIALGIVALAVFSPGFRKVLFAIVAVCVGIGATYYVWNAREERLAQTRVPAADVLFDEMRMASQPYGGYRLHGRVRNQNKHYRVKVVTLTITLNDCAPDSQDDCDTVGETDTRIYLDVPPGQVRDIDDPVYFSTGSGVRRHMQWSYRVSSIEAE
jgi:hypothetical protein